jgi:glycosyltransferase involved in cell wall biosynthesis
LIDAGVFVPIFVEEEDLTAWTALSDAQEVHLSTKKFLFVCEVSNIESDGFDVLLSAYAHSFCEKDDVSLVVLVDLALANAVIAYVDAWKERGADLAGTVIVAPSDETMRKAIFLQSHCLVLPYRFQDVSLSVRRAVALGLPVITTGWGAQVDVKIESPSFNRVRNLDYRFVRCLDEPSLFNNYWAEPDEKHLSRLMLEQFSTAGSSQAEGGSTINAPATAANQLSRKWSQGFSLRPLVIGWVTTWNVRCGIATYSEHLTECIPDDVMILAPRLADKLGLDCDNVIRCWDHTDPNLDELNAAVKRHGINALVVQFNYGFFEFPAITKFLQMQASRGVKVIITLHSTVDPAHAPERRLSLLVPALRTCHRILVHSVSDLNRLKKLGLIDNVTLFPHGVKEISHQASEPSLQVLQSRNSDDFVMASYGFFLPHKGLFELIDAVALLRAKGCNVVLNMFNAQYPNVESQQLVQQANLKIQALGLTQFIKLNSDFLSDEESLAQLKGADLVVYPYQETGESASGAVRFGLAALRPVAVTPLAIFDDVSQAVFKMPGCSTDQIADGLFDLIEGLKSNSNEVIAKRQVLYAWTMAHQYPKLAARLVGIFKACA